MSLLVGKTIDGYELIDILENSKRRISYRARNLETGAFENLQVLPDILQKDPVRVERFVREIRILAGMSHPNIVTCHRAVQLDGHWAMTLELLEGVTLAERLELGPLPAPEAVSVMTQLLPAIECAHARGIIHREITPGNVVLTPDHIVKLTNFTFAKSAADSGLTQVGAIVGDVEYMSPEQVRGMAALDARSDIYSLGAVFYALLTGKPPFQGPTQFDVMMAQVDQEPVPPSQANPNVPAALDPLVLRALAKKPENRYQTAGEFLSHLEMAAPAPATPACSDSSRVESPRINSPTGAPWSIPPWLVAVLVPVLLLVLGVAVSVLVR